MKKFDLELGMDYISEKIVTEDQTAAAYGSGSIYVFATPAMVGLMENASLNCVDKALGEKYSTVGIDLNIKHTAATAMGEKVFAKATLLEVDGKKLTFKVEAYDEKKSIGEGIHKRYIINKEEFMKKIQK